MRIELLVSGDVAGDRLRQQEIRWPDPAEAEWVEGVPVPSLARLIELKLASWDPSAWQEVAALVAVNGLDASFAEELHELVRPAFAEICTLEAQRAARRL